MSPRRLAIAAALAAGFSHGAAAAEPSERVCAEFRGEVERVFATAPDSLQINNLLFEVARNGCVSSLDRLFKAGASPLARNREGATPLAVAARSGRKAVVDILLADASPEARRQLDEPDARGATPLMLAIHAGRAEIIRELLEAGARVDAVSTQGETALSEAAFAGDEDTAALLMKRGAKPDTLDRYGKSVICYAAARGASRLVASLLDAGVDPNARYGGELTALMWAAGFPDLTRPERAAETVKLLIARGAKLDLVDDRGRSALMTAAGLNRFETARVLLEAGADRALRDKEGKTAADLSATQGMRQMLTP